jgi:hypothetical protein
MEELFVELNSATVAKAYENYMTPSKTHEMLAKDTGVKETKIM